jgi:hypothetical protein
MKFVLVLQFWFLLGCWEWSTSAMEFEDRIRNYLEEKIDVDQMILSFHHGSSPFVERNENQQQKDEKREVIERIYPAYPQYVSFLALRYS